MKRKILSLLLILVLCLGLIPMTALPVFADDPEVTVGDGESTDAYSPSYSGYKYGKTQYIILADELAGIKGDTITALKWYMEYFEMSRKTKIILSETEQETLNGFVDVSAEPVAFAGLPQWSVGSNREILITFNTPYEYKGGNLLVTVLDVTGSYESGNYFYGANRDGATCTYYSDSTKFDASYTDYGYTYSFYPKTTFICGDPDAAPEAPVETYSLWLAGTQVNEKNAADLTVIEGVEGTAASYDPDKKTLTLDNVTISGGTYKNATLYSEIYDMYIDVSGNCSVTGSSMYAMRMSSTYLQGSGTLTATGANSENSETCAINAGWLSIYDSLTVNANGGSATSSYGVLATSVGISGTATLNATGGEATKNSYAVYVYDGCNMHDKGVLNAAGGTAGTNSYGIYFDGGNFSVWESTSIKATVKGGSAGTNSIGMYFKNKNNQGLSYGYVYLPNQQIEISGETAAVMHSWSNPPAPSVTGTAPVAFVSDNADGSELKVYTGSVKNAEGAYYKYLGTVPPEGFVDYYLWVGGVRVTNINGADILDDGTASFDGDTNTLYLNNASIQMQDGKYNQNNKAVCYIGTEPLTVEASGTNTLTGGGNNISYSSWYDAFENESAGIYSAAPLTVNVTDGSTLTAKGGFSYTYPSYGIWAEDSLTIGGAGTLNAESGASTGSGSSFIGARFNGDLTLEDSAIVNFTGDPGSSGRGYGFAPKTANWSLNAPDWTGILTAWGTGSCLTYVSNGTMICSDGEITGYEEPDSTEGTVLLEEVLSPETLARDYHKLVIVPYVVPDSYTATLDPKGGTVDPTEVTVSYKQPYKLPTPEREGYDFDGWYAEDYQTAKYTQSLYDRRSGYFLRLSPFDSPTSGMIKSGSIIVFDVVFLGNVPEGIDINDRAVDESCYTIDGNRIYGRIVMNDSLQYNYYGFMDINCGPLSYIRDYTVVKFMIFSRDESKFVDGDTVTKKRPHTLHAGWNAEIPYDLYLAGTRVTSSNADDLRVIEGVDVAKDGEAKYDPSTNTLTLKDVTITNPGTGESYEDFTGIYAIGSRPTTEHGLKIVAEGENTVNGGDCAVDYNYAYGIYIVNGTLDISLADGASLTVNAGAATGEYGCSMGIRGDYVQVSGTGALTANGKDAVSSSLGIYASSRLTVLGKPTVIAAGKTQALSRCPVLDEGVKAAGSTAVDGKDPVEFVEDDFRSYLWVKMPFEIYAVSITPGANMTKTADSGEEAQTGLTGAMTDVVYTANDDCYFPEDYAPAAVSGISVNRDSFTQITVSGTPVADVEITLPDAVQKVPAATPSGIDTTDCTTRENNDGSITGVDQTMEYQKEGDTAWMVIAGDTVTGLAPGNYLVRVKAGDTALASEAVSVTVAEYQAPKFAIAIDGGHAEDGAGNTIAEAVEGETVKAVYEEQDGMVFDHWEFVSGITADDLTDGQFAMPAEAVEMKAVFIEQVAAPVLSAESMTFTETLEVTISCETEGAAIYYTTDGSDPADGGTEYTGPITLDATTTVKAVAKLEGYADSEIVSATYTKRTPSSGGHRETYPVTPAEAENGEVTVSPKKAKKGDTVTITVTPDEGYEADAITVKDEKGNEIEVTDNGDGTYTFTMPASGITVEATFKEAEDSFPFTDVPKDAYCRKAVEWALENGVTGGTSPTTFSPEAPSTRAQMITFLWAASGAPEPTITESPFKDIAEGDYFYKAVLWAYENGITAGVSEDAFGPDLTVTRGQAATFLYGVAGRPETGDEPFTDVNEGDYFQAPVAWAYQEGLTTGTSETTFSPDAPCVRGQIVTFLYLYFTK